MTFDPATVDALTFDVGGSVFDWDTAIRTALAPVAERHGATVDMERFSYAWRGGMFDVLDAVNAGALPWMDADAMHRRALDTVLADFPDLDLSADERDDLTRCWHRMPAWPGAAEGIARLRGRFTTVVFTILSWSIAVDSSKFAGITWDGILSGDMMGIYKPAPGAYRRAAELLRLPAERVMMVAAHPNDLRNAAAVGMRTAYVRPRIHDPGEDYDNVDAANEFDVVADDFPGLAARLGA